jgi:hypothetical protein
VIIEVTILADVNDGFDVHGKYGSCLEPQLPVCASKQAALQLNFALTVFVLWKKSSCFCTIANNIIVRQEHLFSLLCLRERRQVTLFRSPCAASTTMPPKHRANLKEAMEVSALEGCPAMTWEASGRGPVRLMHDPRPGDLAKLIADPRASPLPSEAASPASSSPAPPSSPALPASADSPTAPASPALDDDSSTERPPERPRVSSGHQEHEAPNTNEQDGVFAAGEVEEILDYTRVLVVRGPLWANHRFDPERVTFTVRLVGGREVDEVSGADIAINHDRLLDDFVDKTHGWRNDTALNKKLAARRETQ